MTSLPVQRHGPLTVESAVRAVRGAAALAAGSSMLTETVADVLDRVHRETSPPMGQLCVALERRRVRSQQLRYWAESLQRGANDLLRLADRLDEARRGPTDS